MNTIERSRGFATSHLGLMAGNGYRGASEELDAAVRQGAALLKEAFPSYDIVIRFNSDRCYGGAWLKTGGTDSGIGICAGHYPDSEPAEALLASLEAGDIDWKAWRSANDALPRTLRIIAHVGPRFMPASASGDDYYWAVMPSHDAALAFLLKNSTLGTAES